MRGREVVVLVLLAIVAVASMMHVGRDEAPRALSGPRALLIPFAIAAFIAPVIVAVAFALIAPSLPRLWRERPVALVILTLVLLVPLPAVTRHFSDEVGPENPGGYFPGRSSTMLLGVGLAMAGRIGPYDAWEFDETILEMPWSLAPLLWTAGLAASLPDPRSRDDSSVGADRGARSHDRRDGSDGPEK